ncbi:MAG: site-specific integrase [Chloroflexia bacterium]
MRRLLAAAAPTRWAALVAPRSVPAFARASCWALDGPTSISKAARSTYAVNSDPTGVSPSQRRGARRKVGLPRSVVGASGHRAAQLASRLLAGSEWQDGDMVFCTWQGRPLGARNVYREYRLLLERAGLPPVSFHALRHTHASLMLSQGIHPKVVQERLGHSTVALTLDTYSHLIPSMDRDAADQLDALLA